MSGLKQLIQELCPNGVEYVKLKSIAQYATKRIEASIVNENTYVGVENLLQNKQGKTLSTSVPTEGRVIAYNVGDVLIGNIRPYLKKIWLADCNGGTNGDVLVIQITDKSIISSAFLYYVLSSEKFFHYDPKHAIQHISSVL